MTTSNERNRPGKSSGAGKTADDMKQKAKGQASQLSENAKQQAQSQLDQNRNKASEEMHKVAHATEAAARDLREQNREGLSNYLVEMAHNLDSLADNLRGKSVDELMHQVTDLAKRNPALFITGSVAVGFGLSRFAKSSSGAQETQGQYQSQQFGAQEGDTQSGLYPGYSDSEAESRESTAWGRGYGDTDYSLADYTDRDEPSIDRTSSSDRTLSGEQPLQSGESGRTDKTGRKSL